MAQQGEAQVTFPVLPDNAPIYANVVLVNQLPDGVLLDFGFVDPLLIRREAQSNEGETLTVEATSSVRLAVGTQVARQLLIQLETVLDASSNIQENKDADA